MLTAQKDVEELIERQKQTTRLTVRQWRFIEEFLKCLNRSEAARRSDYSIKRAHQQAYENLKKREIRRIIDDALELETGARLIAARIIGPDDFPGYVDVYNSSNCPCVFADFFENLQALFFFI